MPFTNIVLLLPSPNLDLSVQILRERSLSQRGIHWKLGGYDFFERWIKDECNHKLATFTVFTEGKSPEQGVLEIPCQSDKILSRTDNERRNSV